MTISLSTGRSIGCHCPVCHKKIVTYSNWFSDISTDELNAVELYMHYFFHHTHNAIREKRIKWLMKHLGKYIPLQLLDIVRGTLKTITYPFWLVHECI